MSGPLPAQVEMGLDSSHGVGGAGKDFASTAAQNRKARHRRHFWAAAALLAVMVSGSVLAMQMRRPDDRMSVGDVVEALRSGEFHQGMKLPFGKLPKPWVNDGSDLSTVYVIRDGEHVVLLYYAESLFAACTIEQRPTWSETWHFCDTDLLKAHIERSLKSYPRPMLELDEAGADARQNNGPVLVVWPDGVVAISKAFPRFSPDFQLGRVDAAEFEADLQRFMEQLPSPMPSTADEEKVRMVVWTAGETTKTGQAMTLTQHILPMCFVGEDCPGRLGAQAAATWDQIMRSFNQAAEAGLTDKAATQRAENYWNDKKPPE